MLLERAVASIVVANSMCRTPFRVVQEAVGVDPRQRILVSGSLECKFACEQVTHESDKIVQQECFLQTWSFGVDSS